MLVSENMTDVLIKRLSCDLSFHAGVVFIDKYLKCININLLNNPAFPMRLGIANSDILRVTPVCCAWARMA